MEGCNHSSGQVFLERLEGFSRGFKPWKYILLTGSVLLLSMAPIQCHAAAINTTVTEAEGENNGTLDNQSNSIQSDSGDSLSDSSSAVETVEVSPEEKEEIVSVSDGDAFDNGLSGATISDVTAGAGASGITLYTVSEKESLFPLYETYEEFMDSPVYVTRYENEVLKKLEFMQYADAIMIALLFLLIFKKK